MIQKAINNKSTVDDTVNKTEHKLEELYLLASIVKYSDDAITSKTLDGIITSWNPGAERIYGYTKEEVIGKSISILVPPRRSSELPEIFEKIKSGKNIEHYETERIRKDGTIIDMSITVSPVKDTSGKIIGVSTISREITSQKQASQYARSLIEASLDPLVTISPEGKITDVNETTVKVTGVSREKLIGTDFSNYFTEPAKAREGYRQVFSKGFVADYPLTIRHRDGKLTDVLYNASVYKDTRGNALGVFAAARDVSAVDRELRDVESRKERKRMEGALLESESKYRELVDEVNDGFSINDNEGVITFTNKALAKMMGFLHPNELIGKNFKGFISPDAQKEVLANYKNLREGKKVEDTIISKIIRPDGTTKYLEVKPNLIYKDGKIVGTREVVRDITERKQLEDQLRQSQKMEAVGRLAGGIAHDFNNLLTVILGYSQILQNRLPAEDPLRKDVEEIKKSAQRAASLTKQLLAFSRKQVLQPRKLNLNNVVTETERMLRHLIGENIELVTVTAPMLGSVMADPGQIEQVILNLVVNSRDAMSKGGKLTVETANVHLDQRFVRVNPGAKIGHHAMIAVTDTGSGMDKETLAHLFEPFFTTKPPGKGTGLGLSTVYGIVKQSGGYISAYSEINKGATFKVYLPLVSGASQVEEANKTGKILYKSSETILLAEDEETVRNLATRILSDQGYKILEAAEPLQAIQIMQNHKEKIDLIITDIIMPGMTGLGLVQRIQVTHPDVKVLYISGYTDTTMLHQGVLESDTAFLQKPFTPQALLKKVREVLLGANIVPPQ